MGYRRRKRNKIQRPASRLEKDQVSDDAKESISDKEGKGGYASASKESRGKRPKAFNTGVNFEI